MQCGKLRHRATIQAHPADKNSQGWPSKEWVNIWENAPCDVEDLTGRERYSTQQIVAEATTKITLRGFNGWRDKIKPSCRVLADSRRFDVKYMTNPDGRDFVIVLICTEIV